MTRRKVVNMNEKISHTIHLAIKHVWLNDLKSDYTNHFLLKEDSLKNAFYFHLRTRLGEAFLNENHIRIFTEYYVEGERIDLVVVEIDPIIAEGNYLGDVVKRVLAVVEMKYKGCFVSDTVFYKDIEKVLSFINSWGSNTSHYIAFLQEKYFKREEVVNWLSDEQAVTASGKLTELYAYWDEDSDEAVWRVVEY